MSSIVNYDALGFYHERMKNYVANNGGSSLKEEVVSETDQTLTMAPETVYVIRDRAVDLTVMLGTGVEGKHHEYHAIVEVGQTRPVINWPADTRIGKPFTPATDSVVTVNICNNCLTWGYLYEGSPDELYLYDNTAVDTYCTTESGGWAVSYIGAYNTPTSSVNTDGCLVGSNKSGEYESSFALTTMKKLNLKELYDKGYTTIRATLFCSTNGADRTDRTCCITVSAANGSSTDMNVALGANVSGPAVSASPTAEVRLALATVLASSVGNEGYISLRKAVEIPVQRESAVGIRKLWLSKE